MSAFSVKATITATDQSGPALKSLRRNILAAVEASKKLNSINSKFSMPKLAGGSGVAGGFKAATASANAFTRSLANQNSALSANTAKLRTAQRALIAYAGASGKVAQVPRLQGPPRPGGQYRRGRNSYYGQFPENIPAVLAHRAAHGVVTGGRKAVEKGGEGIMEANTQRALTSLHNLPQELVDKINEESKNASQKWKMITASGMHEIGRGAIGNLADTKEFPQVMDAMGKSIQALTLVYGDASKANEAVRKYYRAADVSGYSSSGKELTMFLDAITRANIKAEKDVNPTVLGNNFRRMGIARFGMDSQFIGDFVNLTDEAQASAGNIIKQLHRELTDSSVAKKDRAAQVASGLRDGNGNVTDSALFQKNKFDWFEKYVVPKMKAGGVNLDKADEVGKAARTMGLKSGALEAVQWYAEKRDEIVRNRKARDKVDLSDKKVQDIPKDSLKAAIEAINSQFKALADMLTKKDAQPTMSKFLYGAASSMQWLSDKASVPGTGDLVKAGTLSGAALTGLGALAVKHVYENPGQDLNTAALARLTWVVSANTAAQGKGALSSVAPGGATAAAGKGMGFLSRLGITGLIASGAYFAAGAPLNETPEQQRKRKQLEKDHNPGGSSKSQDDALKLRMDLMRLDSLKKAQASESDPAAKKDLGDKIAALTAAIESTRKTKAEAEPTDARGNTSQDAATAMKNFAEAGMSAQQLSDKLKGGGDQASSAIKGAGEKAGQSITGAGAPIVSALGNVASQINNVAGQIGKINISAPNGGKQAP